MRIHRLILAILLLLTCRGAMAAEPAPPNILFAIADDWGYGHASAYGCQWVKTPAFDRVAREGLLFQQAYTPNAKCAPSRACILTGRNSWQLKEAANHLCYFPTEFKTWGEALAEKGWHVGYTTKGWGPGEAKDETGKPRAMTGQPFNKQKLTPPAQGIGPNDYASNFGDFLASAPAGKPWCFWYGSIEPHRDYEFGSGIKKAGKKLSEIDHVPGYWPDNETVRTDLLDYAYEVEHFDQHLGRMLKALEEKGLLENTLVIVTSDHGMPFPRCKGGAYEASNHVPLAMMWPKGIRAPGRSIDDFVSFIDLAPTILDVASIPWNETGMAPATGRSLRDIFESKQSGRVDAARDHVLIGMERHDIGRPLDVGYPIRGIITHESLYLHNFEPDRWPACNPETGYLNCDAGATKTVILEARRKAGSDPYWSLCFGKRPREEFYDLQQDRDCIQNLADDPTLTARMEALKNRLFAQLKEEQDPRMDGKGYLFDEYPHSNKIHRGFYERFIKGEKLNTGWVDPTDYEPAPLD
ncbi:sulfatase [Planctopirus limnophila DSM 3776]|uniref:Sulfatase n=1 Tax=Planctopirus limnophila (strain ATCC 43296 / DSM 3776 / IFAM 1008 / Mu 290) TaxID=521674 RepID=D5SUF8_PLAL2|nr:sulfatase [Planctopirus limnophila]ADG69211.1 sulfatase [Planctopirus limnophila DSM 3776]